MINNNSCNEPFSGSMDKPLTEIVNDVKSFESLDSNFEPFADFSNIVSFPSEPFMGGEIENRKVFVDRDRIIESNDMFSRSIIEVQNSTTNLKLEESNVHSRSISTDGDEFGEFCSA